LRRDPERYGAAGRSADRPADHRQLPHRALIVHDPRALLYRRQTLTDRKPTIDDVAALSGVGRTTVSRVLNDGPNVSAKVRDRVLTAVATLGYQVNIQARFLAGGNSRTLALICAADVENEPNSYYQAALEVGALRACAPLGFHLVIHSVVQTRPDLADEIVQLAADSRATGAMLTPPFSDDPALVQRLEKAGCAVVCISPGPLAHDAAPAVGMDDEAAGYALTQALLDLGHRRFGFIKGLEHHLSAEERYRGTLRALADHGLDGAAIVAVRGNFTFKSGKDRLPDLLAATPPPTAIICANDDTAVGALFATHQLGLNVPADLSIASFDDTPVSALVWPPLTTIHQPIQRMSQRAVEILVDRLKANSKPGATALEYLPFTLMIRQSTAAPAA
jgi:LacI family transcriptional regulator